MIWLGALALTACLLACNNSKSESSGQAGNAGGPRALSVDAYVPGHEKLEKLVFATGSLLANESVSIRPERAGKITGIHFNEGQFVRRGALLFSLDDEELKAQKQKLEAQREYFKSELERSRELLNIEAITREELEALQHQHDQVVADLALNKVYLDKTSIYAPFSGYMGLRYVSMGAYVTPSDILVSIDQSHPIKLEFEVPERYLRDVNPGQELTFTVNGIDHNFNAEVYALSNQISPDTRSFTVRAKSGNPDGLLKPGAFARIELVTKIDTQAILIPTDAIIPVLDGQQVFLKKNGKAVAQPVEAGIRKDLRIEILEGVKAGDTVLTSGLLSLSDGIPVTVRSVDSTVSISE